MAYSLCTSVLSTLNITGLLHTWQPCVTHTGSFLSDVSAKVCKKRSPASLTLSYTAHGAYRAKRKFIFFSEYTSCPKALQCVSYVPVYTSTLFPTTSFHAHYCICKTTPPAPPEGRTLFLEEERIWVHTGSDLNLVMICLCF